MQAEWTNRPISSAVERLPYKQDVAGSKPASGISRSRWDLGFNPVKACLLPRSSPQESFSRILVDPIQLAHSSP